jgi:hypothetical protein
VGGGRAVAGRFYDPLKPKQVLAAGEEAAAKGYASRPGLFASDLIEPPGRGPGEVTQFVAGKFAGDEGRRMAESLDEVVKPIAKQLRELDQQTIGYGPTSATLQKLREVLGEEGLAKLVQATRGMSREQAVSYYASRGLPAIGAAVLASGQEE